MTPNPKIALRLQFLTRVASPTLNVAWVERSETREERHGTMDPGFHFAQPRLHPKVSAIRVWPEWLGFLEVPVMNVPVQDSTLKHFIFNQADFMPYRNRILAERSQAWIGK